MVTNIKLSFRHNFPEAMIFVNHSLKYLWAGGLLSEEYMINEDGKRINLPPSIVRYLKNCGKREEYKKVLKNYIETYENEI